MALLLVSDKRATRSGVCAIKMRTAVVALALSCMGLGAVSFGAGMLVAQRSDTDQILAREGTNDPVRERFSMERLAQMSARLLRLESDAQGLNHKIGILNAAESGLKRVREEARLIPGPSRGIATNGDSSGGPLLAPRSCVIKGQTSDTGKTEADLSCLQEKLSLLDQATKDRVVDLMAMPIREPLENARVGSSFGNRVDPFNQRIAFHSGLDFSAPSGTEIRAAAGGTVAFASYRNEMGNMVEIDHGNGLSTRYLHASRLLVKVGDIVVPRQAIALVGSTGRSTGPHLHFEILENGRHVNPAPYLTLSDNVAGL